MGILQRLSLVIRSQINALLGFMEDPEGILDRIVADMTENMKTLKLQVAAAMKDVAMLERHVKENQVLEEDFGKKAILAMQRNDEDLCREALKRKKLASNLVLSLSAELEQQNKLVSSLQDNYRLIESKVNEAKAKKSTLINKNRRAQTKIAMQSPSTAIGTQEDLLEAFQQMAEKINGNDDTATALDRLNGDSYRSKLDYLEVDADIELQLAEIKCNLPAKLEVGENSTKEVDATTQMTINRPKSSKK